MTVGELERKQVIERELLWHEQESHRRYNLDALLYDSPAFDDVVQESIQFLDGTTGDVVLDMGCGEGKEVLALASAGFLVVGTDLSMTQLKRTRDLLLKELPGAKFSLIQANAEQLPFADQSFQRVYGKAILHHLDLRVSANETKRILKGNGRATFAEPLARHFVIWVGRRLTPKLRTADERPVEFSDLESFGKEFGRQTLQAYYFLAPLAYPFRIIPGGEGLFARLFSILSRFDRWLFSNIPLLQKFAWYGVVEIQKETVE